MVITLVWVLSLKQLQDMPKKAHYFPFLHRDSEEELSKLYRRLKSMMLSVHKGDNEAYELHSIAAQHWWVYTHASFYVQVTKSFLLSSKEVHSRKWYEFRMVLWLATYYGFYCKKVRNYHICHAPW